MEKNMGQKTALVLGGGGSRGAYEIGVWQALRELNVSIDMIFGTSIGAINGAMIAQDSYDSTLALWKELDTSTVFQLESDTELANALELIAKKGGSLNGLKSILDSHLNEDKIRSSSIDYGLVTVEFPSLKPLYLTKSQIPQGKLIDYICASASCFPAIHAYEIDGEKFIDGGYADNIPVGMAVDNGATKILSVNLHSIGIDKKVDLPDHVKLIQIGSKWDLGNFMIFDKKNSAKIIRLGYLETLKSFDRYDGTYYTFEKGSFDEESLHDADCAAKFFGFSTEIIYDKQVLNALISRNLAHYKELTEEHNFIEKIITNLGKDFGNFNLGELAEKLSENPATSFLLKEDISAIKYIMKEGLL